MTNTTLNIGMIGTKNFKFMEKSWGRRYIEKSALDKEKWANSADLGVSLDYEVSENFTIDGQILNGEGYKKTQDADGLMRVGIEEPINYPIFQLDYLEISRASL